MNRPQPIITRWLSSAPAGVVSAYAILFSFATYFAMFAFRKPFAAASYDGLHSIGGVNLKTALVIGQIAGYGLAKFVGIKFCSETPRRRRGLLLVAMILVAEASLVLFAVLPPPLKPLGMFLNGAPLGMVWGLVVWYLEGRRSSELLLAGVSCSFILATGAVKDVGRAVLAGDSIPLWGVELPNPLPAIDENWMPAAVGLLFLAPFAVAVALLDQLPEPDLRDQQQRSPRTTMDRRRRTAFMARFLPGMALLLATYLCVTAFRDFRDNFMVELFSELGYSYQEHQTIISQSELAVGFGVALALAALYFVRDNARGLAAVFGVMITGLLLLGGSTWLHSHGRLSGFAWMTLIGLGSYLAYVPFGSVLFDRMMASTRTVGTAV
ncbi:MAG: hypothetical protein IT424_01570, partial [Pirellulales bacterium]|nr:hypothetical protein [Pirellulales bacterium]